MIELGTMSLRDYDSIAESRKKVLALVQALRGTEVQLAAFDDDADYNQLSLVFSSYL